MEDRGSKLEGNAMLENVGGCLDFVPLELKLPLIQTQASLNLLARLQYENIGKAAVQSSILRQLGALLLFKLALADDSARDGAVPEDLGPVVGTDAKGVETAVQGFQNRLTLHH